MRNVTCIQNTGYRLRNTYLIFKNLSTEQSYKRPESILVVVHDPNGMILLLKRADIEDFWQSVTGSLHWDEHPRQAAVRELSEETGISVVHKLLDWQRSFTFEILELFKCRYPPHTHQNLEHMFSLQVETDQPIEINSLEHVSYAWRPYPEAQAMVWSWSNRAAIEAVAQKYWS